MKVSLDWLNDYVKIDRSPEQIGELLSDRGFPIEEIIEFDGDTVLDVEVTSNRGDCLSHIGIAREIAAATGNELKMPEVKIDESDAKAEDFVSVEIEDAGLCGRYTAKIIKGVKLGQSPEWMKKRLEAVGVRPVNNVVDATNYAMLENGQPTHAFDNDKLQGGKIIVRNARKGEKLISIDETKCDLKENMLMIADAKGPVAIAGVMGGLDTEISDSTSTVLLEAAHFDPLSVRTTARGLNIGSEASFRFERNVDKDAVDYASLRTVGLIQMVAGGKAAKGIVDAYPAKDETVEVSIRLERMKWLLGIDIEVGQVMEIFEKLGFEPKIEGDVVRCTSPSWRNDIHREVDLIEEVIRSYGYSQIHTEKRINIEVAKIDPEQKFRTEVRDYLGGSGFYETINVTFTDKESAELLKVGKSEGYLAVKDVTRKSANLLRDSLIGSLMGNYKVNHNAGNTDCNIYELAHTFVKKSGGDMPDEKMKLALLCDSDFRKLKGVVEGLVENFNKDAEIEFKAGDAKWASAFASITVEGKELGYIGLVSKDTCGKMDLKNVEPVVAELDFGTLRNLQSGPVEVKEILRFPAIVRDLSIIVDEGVLWKDIVGCVEKPKCDILEDITFVDIYRGKPIEKGQKSVTLSLCFRDEDGTLTHEQVDKYESAIVESLENGVGAKLRTV